MNGWCRNLAKMQVKGLDDYIIRVIKLADPKKAEGYIKMAVYEGAGIVADEVRRNLERHRDTGDLLDSLYLSTMENDNGYIYTQVGFAGYDRDGVPNAVKANALESGTSRNGAEYQPKTPFIRPAVKRTTEQAVAAMAASLDSNIKKIMGD